MKLEIELSDDVARSLAVIASDKNLGMDTLASIVVCNYVVSRPTQRAADCFYCEENKPLANVVICQDCVDELTHSG